MTSALVADVMAQGTEQTCWILPEGNSTLYLTQMEPSMLEEGLQACHQHPAACDECRKGPARLHPDCRCRVRSSAQNY